MQKQFAIASLAVLIFLTSSSLVAGQKNTCPSFGPWLAFYPQYFTGTWWMYAINTSGGAITASRCQHVEYERLNANDLKVTEYGVNGSKTPSSGTLISSRQGEFQASLDRLKGEKRQYNMIAVDYNNWFIVHNCQIINGKPVETRIIYTRQAEPSQAVIKKMLADQNMTLKGYALVDQKNCQ